MLHAGMAAPFEDVDEPDEVALDVGVRIGDRVSHAGLCGQVDHAIEALFPEQPGHAVTVGQVHTEQTKPRLRCESREARLLERGIVIVVDDIEAHHLIATGQQTFAGMIADEARGSGHQNFCHALIAIQEERSGATCPMTTIERGGAPRAAFATARRRP